MEKKYNIVLCGQDKSVEITITNANSIQIKGLATEEEFDKNLNAAKNIWEMYKRYRENDSVVRSGSGYCGVYSFSPAHPIFEDYIETDTLHSTTAEEILQLIFRFYPKLFDIYRQKRIIQLIRYHDLGEEKDVPDDGSMDADEKFEVELGVFINRIKTLPPFQQVRLIKDFIMFEHAGERWMLEDKECMQFAKLGDKLDAPIGALWYELNDRKGSLAYKKEHFGGITDQDKMYIKETGDDSQAGVWSAHYIDKYKNYQYLSIFVEILIEACKDVRGSVFPWMYEFSQKRGLNERLLEKML